MRPGPGRVHGHLFAAVGLFGQLEGRPLDVVGFRHIGVRKISLVRREAWSIAIGEDSERQLINVRVASNPEDVCASLWVASHGEGMRVIGRDHDQGLFRVQELVGVRDGLVKLEGLLQRRAAHAQVVRLIDPATFDEENKSVGSSAQQVQRNLGHFW
uniref:Putative secreted protein n=1 Tax=Ixodes ricinus TaxID=34613 RepID=A0A6B0UWM8_IXORI